MSKIIIFGLNLCPVKCSISTLMGMFVASRVVLAALDSDLRNAAGELIFPSLDEAAKAVIRTGDLQTIRNPYAILGCVVLVMLVIIALVKMPSSGRNNHIQPMKTIRRLSKNKVFRGGVFTQIFYVAAQIMCWTYIIQYADNLGINKADAQLYNIIAMGIFLGGRFVATALMKYVNSRKLLMIFAIAAICTIIGTIFIEGMVGLYCLIATSAFMSLMFPTIYGIALESISKEDATLGAAFLVMAIVGGAIMPKLQAMIIDLDTVGALPAVNVSFVLPLICFVVISIYGYRSYKQSQA